MKIKPAMKLGWEILLTLSLAGAGLSGTATAQVPQISLPLVPSSAAPGSVAPAGPGLTITVNGTGFNSGSVVNWNGSPRATAFCLKH